MQVAVIGTGHVGLITCVSLASIGHNVIGNDLDLRKISELGSGIAPFFEPQLDDLLSEGLASGRLSFTDRPEIALADADVIFICVGTPARADGEANLVAVEQAARSVANHAKRGAVVIEKSTVPTGTAARVERTLMHESPELAEDLEVVSNPEFLREGSAILDSLSPDRILVGARSERAFTIMRRLYAGLIERGCELIETDIATSELAKHACNAFLALKISYANALARLCERAEADVMAVTRVMGADSRIGSEFLRPGLGYGGYCFPKDLVAFERLASRLGYEFPLLREVGRINQDSVQAAVDKIRDALWNIEDKRITLLGLAFKPGTDDIRFSPALALAHILIAEGAEVVAYDPQAAANAMNELPDLKVALDPYAASEGSHCLVMCTEWEEFGSLDLVRVREAMMYPIVVDGRNVFDPEKMEAAGFAYYSMGRPHITARARALHA
jgi:UDPglucose 6-dehydrogenase